MPLDKAIAFIFLMRSMNDLQRFQMNSLTKEFFLYQKLIISLKTIR